MKILSICIPSYNYGHYLPEAIESCLQSDADFRLVVLDNASNDCTPKLKSIYAKDSRVEWHRNDHTLDIQANWNRAVDLCDTPWVKMLQADDKLAPGAVSRLLDIIKSRPGDSFHAFSSAVIDKNGKLLRKQSPYTANYRPYHLSPGAGVAMKLRQEARLKEPTSNMFTKEAWRTVGGYPSDLRFTFDIAFNVELMAKFSGTLWSEYLAYIRRHPGSDGSRLPAQLAIDDLLKLHERILFYTKSYRSRQDATAWLSYRILELVGQRFLRRPYECLELVANNIQTLGDFEGWSGTLSMVYRRIKTGDVQKIIK